MNEQQLYEKQYGEKKLMLQKMSFPLLRRLFKRFDLSREDLVVSMLDKGNKFLDLGCGNGSLIFKLKDKFSELYGVDISPSRIKETEERARSISDSQKFHFIVSNLNEKIPLPDKMFDAITCVATLEHLFDPYFVIDEIYRLLRPDGILILEVPNIAYFKYRLQLLFGKLPATSAAANWKESGWDGGHLHYFTKKSLIKL
jgi:ubiquinone/menaquinone biosynthesis C-methylase UbiE